MKTQAISIFVFIVIFASNAIAQDDKAIQAKIDSLAKEKAILDEKINEIQAQIAQLESKLAVQEIITDDIEKSYLSRGVVSRKNAKIREEPSAFSEITGTLGKGQKVIVSDYREEYFLVEAEDEKGWVHQGYLVETTVLKSYARAADLRRAEEARQLKKEKKKNAKKN